jgi:flagellar hook-basal body complex protein FliE
MDVRSTSALSKPILPPMEPLVEKRAGGFEDLLRSTLGETNQYQVNAERSIEALATGENPDPTAVVNAVNRADLAFRTLIQIRNKLVQAYDELRQMQI